MGMSVRVPFFLAVSVLFVMMMLLLLAERRVSEKQGVDADGWVEGAGDARHIGGGVLGV